MARGRVPLGAAAFSVLLHVAALSWLFLRATEERVAEPAPMVVELVDLSRPEPKPPQREAAQTGRPQVVQRVAREPVEKIQLNPPASASTLANSAPDLMAAPFAEGRRKAPPTDSRRRPCDPRVMDETLEECRREQEIARGVTRSFDPQNGDDEFAREARRKEAMRAYREGSGGYPGLRCAIFHRC